MHAESLTIYDVEHCVLTGAIIGRQPDNVADEWTPPMICEVCGQDIDAIIRDRRRVAVARPVEVATFS